MEETLRMLVSGDAKQDGLESFWLEEEERRTCECIECVGGFVMWVIRRN